VNPSNQFREYTRLLERKLNMINADDCSCCEVNALQCHILVEIGRCPGSSLKDIATIVEVDKSVASRAVEDLVKHDMVLRKPSKVDRRWVELELTVKGNERFQKIETDMNHKFQAILEAIPQDKRDTVMEALELYIDACSRILEEKENDNTGNDGNRLGSCSKNL